MRPSAFPKAYSWSLKTPLLACFLNRTDVMPLAELKAEPQISAMEDGKISGPLRSTQFSKALLGTRSSPGANSIVRSVVFVTVPNVDSPFNDEKLM